MNYELLAIFVTIVIQGLYVAYKMGKFEEKLSNVEKKQDKHNDVISRTFLVEKRIDVLDERVAVANHRIEDLEGM